MATSDVEICQLALSHIRGGSILSLTEASLQAQQCKLLYPNVRDMVLKAAPWGFNKRIAALSLRSDTVFGWSYLYQYPVDAIRINRLILNYAALAAGDGSAVYRPRHWEDVYHPDLSREVKYEVFNVAGQKVIAANEPELRIEYGAKVTNVAEFDIEFDMALSHLLAAELALPLVGGDTGLAYERKERAMYLSMIAEAIASSLNEKYSEPVDSEFVTVRKG